MAEVISLSERLARQVREALSDENLWFAGEKLGRRPSPEEALKHYIRNGGAQAFAEKVNTEDKKPGP